MGDGTTHIRGANGSATSTPIGEVGAIDNPSVSSSAKQADEYVTCSPDILDVSSLPSGTYKFVPDYDRTGTVEVSKSFKPVYEQVSTKVWSRDDLEDAEDKIDFPVWSNDIVRSRLPGQFHVGGFFSETTEGFVETPDRIADRGGKVVRNGGRWVQDVNEPALNEKDEIVPVFTYTDFGKNAGNVFFARNSDGDPVIVISETEVSVVQSIVLRDHGKALTRSEAKRLIADRFGLKESQVVDLPVVSNYVHLDQLIFFPKDGKAIVMALPDGHPDAAAWNDGLLKLKAAGLEIGTRIEVPEYFLNNTRSPLNILTFKDETTGRSRFLIPVDPVMIITSDKGAFVDLRTGEGFGGAKDLSESSMIFRYDLLFIYDKENPWPHVEAIKKSLMDMGVPEEDIVLFDHNGAGRGSLHCITNVQPK